MTILGGKDVLALLQTVGWHGDDAKLAAAVAYAASRWHDHYEVRIPGSPSADRFGLFALSADQLAPLTRAQFFDARANARRAFALWQEHGRTWEWLDVVRSQNGTHVRTANADILDGNLFARPTVGTFTIREGR